MKKHLHTRLTRAVSVLLIAALCAGLFAMGGCGKKDAEPAAEPAAETAAAEPLQLKACAVSLDEEFGAVNIDCTIDDFNAMGFQYGDSVDVAFSNGYALEGIPYYNGYYNPNGTPLVIAYPGAASIQAAINYGDSLWEVAKLTEGDTVTITLAEAGSFRDIQDARDIHYVDDRSAFSNDAVFANFRAVSVTGIAENVLYRAASPCNNLHNRAPYVDALMGAAGVRLVIDLADTDEKIAGYMAKEDFASPNFAALYENGKVCPLAMSANFYAEDFRSKLVTGLTAMIDNDGPYLVHCTEGKDRTGFVCMLLEALCGASYEEIAADYMITYDNYYQMTESTQKERYDTIVASVLDPMVQFVAGDENADLKTVDLAQCAADFLERAGLSAEQISALRAKLG